MKGGGALRLADALEDTRPQPVRCTIGKILDSLEGEDRATLEHALDPESGWAHVQIARALAKIGIKARGPAIGQHRRGVCSCP